MKTIISLVAAVCVATPAIAEQFRPEAKANPWTDDYSHLTSMESWKDWGTYNVHDPSCRKVGDTYYMYSTDAIFRENRKEAKEKNVPLGFIQMRSSKDLVNWEFVGWAFPEIPQAAIDWVRSKAEGKGAYNIWAPYMVDAGNGIFRLYYCVSAFGLNTSYIGMAEATHPAGPWHDKGAVVLTDNTSRMNAIDPSVITGDDGRQWMHYGSYFGGLFCVELDPATGFTMKKDDQGHLMARRANWKKDNLEAPEIMKNAANGKYYLFQSYDPLMTTYNVRVGRSDKAEGPFLDFYGKNIADTTNNFPILTAPYRFEGHPGWVGTAHCGIIDNGEGRYFMAHQGRYAKDAGMMDLHVREVFFTDDGWPVVSPERYTGLESRRFAKADLEGEWEFVRVLEPRAERQLEAGQILWGEGDLRDGEWNDSFAVKFDKKGKLSYADGKGSWNLSEENQTLTLKIGDETISNLIVHHGHDWERETDTVLVTGLDSSGRSVWGKRVK